MNSAYHRRVAFPSELANSTSRQLQSTSPALIIPVGSTEQHGPHLPLDTDTRIATAVARSVADRLADRNESNWVLAPAIGYGASGEHEGFAGTVSIGTSALRLLLVEFGRSACAAGRRGSSSSTDTAETSRRWPPRWLCFGTRAATSGWCSCTRRERRCARRPHRNVCIATYFAGPTCGSTSASPATARRWPKLMPQMRQGGVAAVSELGVLGDPTTATAEEGERIFAEMVDACSRRITRWAPDRDGMLT